MLLTMVTTDFKTSLDRVAQDLGYRSAADFTRIQLQSALERKIAYYQSRIDAYEAKYGMNFTEFRRRVVDRNDLFLSRFGIVEKEDDDNDWDDALDYVEIYAQNLSLIRP